MKQIDFEKRKTEFVKARIANMAFPRHVEEDFTEACKDCFDAGAKCQTEQSPWISVEERLPAVGEKVFAIIRNHKCLLTSMYIPKDYKGNILGEKEWHGSGIMADSIIAWMPIPKFNV